MQVMPSDRRIRLLCAAVVATALAATGCHMENPDQPTPTSQTADLLGELSALPSLEDTKTRVQAAMDEITTPQRRDTNRGMADRRQCAGRLV
jgi:hypothetical protein